MALPLIPLLKIIALGSIKILLLVLGAVFVPVYALRLILTGASGMLLPVLDWLEANNRLDAERHRAVVEDLDALSGVQFSRAEARHLLLGLTSKTVRNMGVATVALPRSIISYIGRLIGRGDR